MNIVDSEVKEKYAEQLAKIHSILDKEELKVVADKWYNRWIEKYEKFASDYKGNMLKAAIGHLTRAAYLITKERYADAKKHTRKALTILERYGD